MFALKFIDIRDKRCLAELSETGSAAYFFISLTNGGVTNLSKFIKVVSHTHFDAIMLGNDRTLILSFLQVFPDVKNYIMLI